MVSVVLSLGLDIVFQGDGAPVLNRHAVCRAAVSSTLGQNFLILPIFDSSHQKLLQRTFEYVSEVSSTFIETGRK